MASLVVLASLRIITTQSGCGFNYECVSYGDSDFTTSVEENCYFDFFGPGRNAIKAGSSISGMKTADEFNYDVWDYPGWCDCGSDGDCVSYNSFNVPTGFDGVCKKRAAVGASCYDDNSCQTMTCQNNKCAYFDSGSSSSSIDGTACNYLWFYGGLPYLVPTPPTTLAPTAMTPSPTASPVTQSPTTASGASDNGGEDSSGQDNEGQDNDGNDGDEMDSNSNVDSNDYISGNSSSDAAPDSSDAAGNNTMMWWLSSVLFFLYR